VIRVIGFIEESQEKARVATQYQEIN